MLPGIAVQTSTESAYNGIPATSTISDTIPSVMPRRRPNA